MRRILLAALAVATMGLTALPGAVATDTGSLDYISPGVVRVNHGIPGVTHGTGTTWCYPSDVINEVAGTTLGCIGGGIIPTSEAKQIIADGGNPDADATKYLKMTAIATDTLNGPNIHVLLCNYNPAPGAITCETDGSGSTDGLPDAAAEGCGVGVTADSTGMHPGNYEAVVWIGILWVDVGTTEVCFGTQGSMSILFW